MPLETDMLVELKRALADRNRAAVNAAAARLIAARPKLGPQWQSIATALLRNGENSQALAAADRMSADLGHDASAGLATANILYRAGQLQAAWDRVEQLVSRGQEPGAREQRLSYLNFRASLALMLGRKMDARSALDEALELDPLSGQAWFSLSEVADFAGSDSAALERLQRANDLGPSDANESVKLRHALGRALHQIRDHEGAFSAFALGAREQLSAIPQSARRIDRVEFSASYDRQFIDSVAAQITVPHERLVFVSGLPRSGTTLVEQVLVSHSEVQHGQELGFFSLIAEEVGGIEARHLRAWLERGNDPNDLVRLYLHLIEERFGPNGKVVDKSLEAGNYMGLLLSLFPNAPVLWLRREPVDNGWSAFRTLFARGCAWSWDLEDIGRRLVQEDRIVDYWQREAADRITFIDYATLVQEPQEQIARIAENAGLPLEPAMLTPNATKRAVSSASVSQVREPINLKGLGVAGPYRPWLGPMITAYRNG